MSWLLLLNRRPQSLAFQVQLLASSLQTAPIFSVRRRLRDAFRPAPSIPGTVDALVIDPEAWARLEPADVRYALKRSLQQYVYLMKGSFTRASASTEAESGSPSLDFRQAHSSGAVSDASSISVSSPGTSPIRSVPPEKIREIIDSAGSWLGTFIRNPEARGKAVAQITKAVLYLQSIIDEFLAGYQQGLQEEEENGSKNRPIAGGNLQAIIKSFVVPLGAPSTADGARPLQPEPTSAVTHTAPRDR